MATAGGGMAAPCWVLRCCSCRLFQAQQVRPGRHRAPGSGQRAAGTRPRLTPFCSPLGQAERQVELQRVRAAAGPAQGEGRGLHPRRAPSCPPRCPPPCLSPQVYGRGSGRDCRHHVQKLNSLQGEAEEAIARTARYGTGGAAGARLTRPAAGQRAPQGAGLGGGPVLPSL